MNNLPPNFKGFDVRNTDKLSIYNTDDMLDEDKIRLTQESLNLAFNNGNIKFLKLGDGNDANTIETMSKLELGTNF